MNLDRVSKAPALLEAVWLSREAMTFSPGGELAVTSRGFWVLEARNCQAGFTLLACCSETVGRTA